MRTPYLQNGYRLIPSTTHPLATDGYVREHRAALWDHCGFGSADPFTALIACHWCRHPIPWRSRAKPAWRHSVNVDHLDGDRVNNDPTNLVASCGWCNANREWMTTRYPATWEMIRHAYATIHPASRPAPLQVVAELTGITLDDLIAERLAA